MWKYFRPLIVGLSNLTVLLRGTNHADTATFFEKNVKIHQFLPSDNMQSRSGIDMVFGTDEKKKTNRENSIQPRMVITKTTFYRPNKQSINNLSG